MSACNIIKTDDAAYMFTDAASYYADGTLGAVGQKVAILAHANAAISCRGPRGFLETVAAMVNCAYSSFDDLATDLAVVVEAAYEADRDLYASCATGPEVEVFLAGWSEGRDKPESYVVCSHELYGPAWTLQELGPVAIAPFDETLGERLAGMEPSEDVVAVGVAVMEAQRALRGQHVGEGEAVSGVGGFCQWTKVSRESVQTAIARHWRDVVGEKLGLAA